MESCSARHISSHHALNVTENVTRCDLSAQRFIRARQASSTPDLLNIYTHKSRTQMNPPLQFRAPY